MEPGKAPRSHPVRSLGSELQGFQSYSLCTERNEEKQSVMTHAEMVRKALFRSFQIHIGTCPPKLSQRVGEERQAPRAPQGTQTSPDTAACGAARGPPRSADGAEHSIVVHSGCLLVPRRASADIKNIP